MDFLKQNITLNIRIMKSNFSVSIAILLLFGLSSFKPSIIQPPKGWVHLGSKKVNWSVEKDIIEVGNHEGSFTKLKIKVTGGAINMRKMIVTYGNGNKENIPLKFHFKRGAESTIIDLKGGKRKIKKITFWYDTKNRSKRRATNYVAGKRI